MSRKALAAFLLALAVLLFPLDADAQRRRRRTRRPSPPPTENYPNATQVGIVNDAFTINAGSFVAYSIYVGGYRGDVYGRFKASSGTEVFILDPDGYANFQAGYGARAYYNSGRVVVANIQASLQGGQYFLVFSNRFSVLTSKAVTAQVNMTVWQ